MIELPQIFDKTSNDSKPQDLIEIACGPRWLEFIAHVVQYGETSVTESKILIDDMINQESDPVKLAILHTGFARCQLHHGDFINGPKSLGYAYSLTTPADNDAQSFILLEMVSFMAITGQYDLGLMLCDKIPALTGMEYLLRLANYYWFVLKIRKGDSDSIKPLQESAEYFLGIKEWATVSYHYKNIGNIYRKMNDYEQSEQYYNNALSISKKREYDHISAAIMHDQAMLYYHQKNPDKALQLMDSAFSVADSKYTKCFILGNMGLIYQKISDSSSSKQYFQKALNIANEHGLDFLVPSISYNLAELHFKNNPDLGIFFLKMGYESSIKLLQNHYPYSGFRQKSIEAYVQSVTNPELLKSPGITGKPTFAEGRTLQESRNLFQRAVLDILGRDCNSVSELLHKLNLPKRSYYEIRNRVKQEHEWKSIPYFESFLSNQNELNWKTLNQKFENELVSHLFAVYDQNKVKLSEQLGISYSHTLKLTSGLKKSLVPVSKEN